MVDLLIVYTTILDRMSIKKLNIKLII